MTRKQRTKKGISLAKGPVWLVGLALLAYGITDLIFGGHSFAQHALTGAVYGKTWLGLEVNGWSGLLFIAAGLLLMIGAPLHWGAKGMSLLVGIALVVVCLIALANGHGAVGLFAANHLTELVWAAAGALLIVLSLMPRVGGRTRRRRDDPDPAERRPARRRVETEPRIVERELPADPTRGVERPGYPADGTLATARGMTPAAATTVQNRETTTGANAGQSAAPGVQPAAHATIKPSTQPPVRINHD
jgi:hypothetical protein